MTRRQEILSAAGDLFRKQGYHATSMRDIARSVDLGGSSLYAHIRSKEELLADIVNEAADAFLAAAATVDPGLPGANRLRALVHGHVRVVAEHLPYATVFLHEWTRLGAVERAAIVTRRDQYQRHFRAAIEDGIREGGLGAVDASLATLLVLSALNWTYQWLDPRGRFDLDTLAEHYADMLLRALGAVLDAGKDPNEQCE